MQNITEVVLKVVGPFWFTLGKIFIYRTPEMLLTKQEENRILKERNYGEGHGGDRHGEPSSESSSESNPSTSIMG